MNVLMDRWIHILRRSGRSEYIAPWEITDSFGEDPVERLLVPRPDMLAAVREFLIGLFQTFLPPKKESDWKKVFENPPNPEELYDIFKKKSYAFELLGDGPRFLQDPSVKDVSSKGIASLLIDEPGAKTAEDNLDFFVPSGQIQSIGLPGVIMALISLQTYAPAGGAGIRTSLRGGGPLTTLVIPGQSFGDSMHCSLWHKIWVNILPQKDFYRLVPGNREKNEDASIFPWLGKVRVSGPEGVDTTPQDMHPLHVFWGMPRRIYLDDPQNSEAVCGITGEKGPVITTYRTQKYGVNYTGPWKHPLSPYRFDKEGQPIPLHPGVDGFAYRHWLALALGDPANTVPAEIVKYAGTRRAKFDFELSAFGYDMDNMKARGWHEGTVPFYNLENIDENDFRDEVKNFLEAAEQIARNLRQTVLKAWFGNQTKGKSARGVEASFWAETETVFYAHLDKLYAALKESRNMVFVAHAWHKALNSKAMELFERWVVSGRFEYEDPGRSARARRELLKFNHSKKIKSFLKLDQQGE